jgi:putative flippase GtrA
LIKHFASKQFLAFILTGCLAAAVNFGSRIVYSLWVEFSAAVILAYITGMVTAFILARAFVFRASKRAFHHSILLFVVVNLLAVAQTWTVSMLLAYLLLPAMRVELFVQEIAHGIGVVVPVFTSYLGHKYWSFREW